MQQNEKAEKKIQLENMKIMAAHNHQQNDTKRLKKYPLGHEGPLEGQLKIIARETL